MEEYFGMMVPALKPIAKRALSEYRINSSDIAEVMSRMPEKEPETINR